MPDVELKGERGHYLFLVQGAESGSCTARLIHTANQINGAAALATLNALIREKAPPPSGIDFFYARLISAWMCPGAAACLEQIFEICYKSMRGPIWCLVKEVGPGGSFIRARLNPYGSLIYHWSHLDVFEMRWQRNMTLLDYMCNILNVPNAV